MTHQAINTPDAPQAIGTYSQAVKTGAWVFLSGQIPLLPDTMTLHPGETRSQIEQVFNNLRAVARAAGGDLGDIVKLTIFLTDLTDFTLVNEVMTHYFQVPYPARAVVGVANLPKGAVIEVEAILCLSSELR